MSQDCLLVSDTIQYNNEHPTLFQCYLYFIRLALVDCEFDNEDSVIPQIKVDYKVPGDDSDYEIDDVDQAHASSSGSEYDPGTCADNDSDSDRDEVPVGHCSGSKNTPKDTR